MAATVLTQAPLSITSHAHARTTSRTVLPSATAATAAISMRSYIDDKARLAETAHLEYASLSKGCPADEPPPTEPSASSSSYSNHSVDSHSVSEDATTSLSDTGHRSGATRLKTHADPAAAHIPSPPLSSDSTRPRSKYDDLVEALAREPPVLSIPPPVPPKTDLGHRSKSKSVSIVAPSDQSHDQEDRDYAFAYTVSEPGHTSTPSASTSAWGSDRAPHRRTFGSQSLSGHTNSTYSYPSRLSWADKASVPIYRNSFPFTGKQTPPRPLSLSESPSQVGRRKLKKALGRPSSIAVPMSTTPSSPRTGSRIWRALSLRSSSAAPDAPQSPRGKTSSMFFRSQHRSISENGLANASSPTRPPVQTRDSGGSTSASRSHSSSISHSTCFSSPSSWSHSTPVTPPDDTSPLVSPMESSLAGCVPEVVEEEEEAQSAPVPQLSRGTGAGGTPTRKLKKRRPSEASSRLNSSDFVPALSRSKTQAHVHSTSSALSPHLRPINPETPFGLEIPKELTQSPRSIFPSKFLSDRNKKSSTNALAQLAWTGLSSPELAALTSRLNVQKHSPERAAQLAKQDLDMQPGGFDPYGESLYASGGNPNSTQINRVGDIAEAAEQASGSSLLGHAVSNTFSTMRKKVTPVREIHAAYMSAPGPSASSLVSPKSVNVPTKAADLDALRFSLRPTPRPTRQQPTQTSFLDNDPMAMRRWTLAMADVPDEVLVQELDRLWKEGSRRNRGSKRGTPASSQHGHGSDCGSRDRRTSFIYGDSSGSQWKHNVQFQLGGESDSEDEDGFDDTVEEPEDVADEEEWKNARRALLCCRELVRTERNYQARLRQLLNAESSHPLFSLLLSYVPALLQASEALLVRLVDDPSAWGVSAAFIGCEEELEAAFVAWCGIVGEFFTEPGEKDKRGRKPARKANEEAASAHGHGEMPPRPKGAALPLSARSMSQGRLALGKPKIENRRLSLFGVGESGGMFTAALGTGLALGLSSSSQPQGYGRHGSTASVGKESGHGPTGPLTRTLSAWKRKSMPSSLYHIPSSTGLSPPPNPPTQEEKKLTVRDLAIQPTQRVMRYVLQYKDLLAHTPIASPSRGLVERALENAISIAKKCDRAQGNSAFLRR